VLDWGWLSPYLAEAADAAVCCSPPCCCVRAVLTAGAFATCRTILKRFSIDHKDYKGTIQDVDTEVETDDGLQQGLFYRVV
jgi:hypothetical protein